MDLNAVTPDSFMANTMEVLNFVNQDENWQKLPMLNNINNLTVLKDLQLVRFRGIVQDMLDPEIYLETFETKNADNVSLTRCSKYRDNLNLEVSK